MPKGGPARTEPPVGGNRKLSYQPAEKGCSNRFCRTMALPIDQCAAANGPAFRAPLGWSRRVRPQHDSAAAHALDRSAGRLEDRHQISCRRACSTCAGFSEAEVVHVNVDDESSTEAPRARVSRTPHEGRRAAADAGRSAASAGLGHVDVCGGRQGRRFPFMTRSASSIRAPLPFTTQEKFT
jgi:hypothetical protein